MSSRFRLSLIRTLLLAGIAPLGVIGAPVPETSSNREWGPTTEEGWVVADLGDLSVKPGSALDFSRYVEAGPAGKYGFAQVNAQGEIVFEQRPDQPLRIFACQDPLEYWEPETPEEIAAFAEQIRLAGYNCFRAHCLDLMLMIGTEEDLVPNPKQMERWDLLCAELKKRGIYLYVDLTTSWYAFYGNSIRGHAWTPEGQSMNLYGRLYFQEQKARDHWAAAVRMLLDHVNPRTGLALKRDPQVLVLGLRNEAGLHFLLEHRNRDNVQINGLTPRFQQWLRQHYGTIDALNKAWGGPARRRFEDVTFPDREGIHPPTQDLQRFIVDVEVEVLEWMQGVVKEIGGVRALLQDFNAGVAFANNLTRSHLPMVESHTYHDHPTAYISPGSRITNLSGAGQGFPFISWMNEVRQLDRPFLVTEWGYPYWNQWRHEGGLSAPAYAALQGWDMLTHAHESVKVHKTVPPRPFKIASDPPGRLADRMALFLYARGDVATSQRIVEVKMDPEGIFRRMGGENHMPSELRRLTLLSRTGIRVVDYPAALPGASVETKASLRIHDEQSRFVWEGEPQSDPASSLAGLVAGLRQRGILSKENRTDAARGIFQSDTGQLTLDTAAKMMKVDTPRSQGATLPAGSTPARLADVTFANEGDAACYFIASLDDRPLAQSEHMLLLVVGDALNSGALFADRSRRVLKKHGGFPVMVRPMKGRVTLHRSLPEGVQVTFRALAFNGDPVGEFPVELNADGVVVPIDTGGMSNPIFQYELILSRRKR